MQQAIELFFFRNTKFTHTFKDILTPTLDSTLGNFTTRIDEPLYINQ